MTTIIPPKVLRALDTLFEEQPGPFTIELPSGKTVFIMKQDEYERLLADSIQHRSQTEEPETMTANDVINMLD